MPRVSEEHLTARRAQILAAARTCFLRDGLHATSMQDLIREAGLSVGAVYRYFRSKDEIVEAISEQVAGALAGHFEDLAAAEPRPSLADTLDRVLGLVDGELGPDGDFRLAVHVWSEAALDDGIRDIVRRRYGRLRGALVAVARRAVEAGELPPDADPEAVGAVLFGLTPGYALQRMLVGAPDRRAYLAGVRALLAAREPAG